MNGLGQMVSKLLRFISNLLRLLFKGILQKKNLPFILILIVISCVIYFFTNGVGNLLSSQNSKSGQIQVAPAKATTSINKEFTFPLKNEKGLEVSKVKYIIESAELRNEIVVKGQKARSVKGRTFLIFNLKVVNDFKQKIEIQTSDYLRLSVNGNKDAWLAPDIHSDPVAIQAISTKYIKVGFAINESDKDLLLKVGEINGEKQDVEVKF